MAYEMLINEWNEMAIHIIHKYTKLTQNTVYTTFYAHAHSNIYNNENYF